MSQVSGPDYERAVATARTLIRKMGYLPVSGWSAAEFLRVPIIDVWSKKLLPRDSGVTMNSPTGIGVRILVSAGPFPGPRLNWTIAHEVGHIALGHLFEISDPTRCEIAAADAEAHAFAAELLMPSALVLHMRWMAKDLAWRCGVSLQAARIRLAEIGLWLPVGERGMDLVRLWGRRPPEERPVPKPVRRETVADGWQLAGAPPVSDAVARAYLEMIREEEDLRRLAADDAAE